MTKKNTLAISAMYAVFFVVIFALSEFCHSDWCRVHDDDPLGWVFFIFLPLLPHVSHARRGLPRMVESCTLLDASHHCCYDHYEHY